MAYIFISVVVTIAYFVIVAIKEGEARETIERERKVSNIKIANLHFQNLVAQEQARQKIIEESKENYIQQLQKEEGFHQVSFNENALIIVLENDVDVFDADELAETLLSSFLPSTGIDVIKIYIRDGIIIGFAKRNGVEDLSENKSHLNFNENISTAEKNEIEETKFRISSMFYRFCFSDETAKTFLEESEIRQLVIRNLISSVVNGKNTIEDIFKIFIKKKYNFILGESSYGRYRINGYEFLINKITVELDTISTFFEICYTDFEDVKDESGINLAIAKEFILYVKHFKPVAIFVLVYDPFLQKYALRRSYENGTSVKLTFFDNNDGSDCINYLEDYIEKNIF